MKTYFSRGHSWVDEKNVAYQLLGGYEAVRENMDSFVSKVGVWTFDYVLTYGGEYTVNDKPQKWVRSAKLGRLYPPGTKIEYNISSVKTPIKTLFISFKILNGEKFNQFDLEMNDHFRFHDSNNILQKELQNIVDTANYFEQGYFYKAQGSFYQVLNILFNAKIISSNEYKIEKPVLSKVTSFSNRVRKVLMDNLENKLTLEEIAEMLNISKSKLSHRYRLENGESPMSSFSKMKIEKAKMYLLNGEVQKVIAESLGYSDEYHFSKNFKQVTGKSPTEFKQDF